MCQAVYVMQTAQNKIDNVYVFYLFKVQLSPSSKNKYQLLNVVGNFSPGFLKYSFLGLFFFKVQVQGEKLYKIYSIKNSLKR